MPAVHSASASSGSVSGNAATRSVIASSRSVMSRGNPPSSSSHQWSSRSARRHAGIVGQLAGNATPPMLACGEASIGAAVVAGTTAVGGSTAETRGGVGGAPHPLSNETPTRTRWSMLADRSSADASPLPPSRRTRLLELDLGASFLELLLDLLRLGLVDAGLDVLRRAVDEILGVLEAETGDLADDLDDADLVGAAALEDDGELRLLLGRSGRSRRATTGCRRRRNGNRSRLDAPLVLERLGETDELDHRETR